MEIDKEIFEYVSACAHSAKKASELLAISSIDARNKAILCMAAALRDNEHEILSANKVDIEAARAQNTKESLIDRLALSKARIDDMAKGLEALVSLVDPLGVVQEERILESGINLKRISVPLGVVAVVYEARPNVGADAAGICLKAGNAVILRGGSLAANSNKAIASVLHDAAFNAGLPKGCIEYIATTQRCATDALMSMHGVVDVLIPRGGAGLINHCVEHSRVPVIETGTGNCHIYVHESANLEMALRIVVNAKCRRYGVCNAAETLLVDSSIANDFLPLAFEAMAQKDILLHCDELSLEYAQAFKKHAQSNEAPLRICAATCKDWEEEYLGPELAIRCVSGVDEAISHINTYSTKHSEAIVANTQTSAGKKAIEAFFARVDSACVYANASTAFSDGGMFGLGAEIGISTQKLHARGPFSTAALTSYKYILSGSGQVRD